MEFWLCLSTLQSQQPYLRDLMGGDGVTAHRPVEEPSLQLLKEQQSQVMVKQLCVCWGHTEEYCFEGWEEWGRSLCTVLEGGPRYTLK